MIFGHLKNLDAMRSWMPLPVMLALDYLKTVDYSNSPGGQETRIAPAITAKDARVTTMEAGKIRPEIHRKNIDIQFLLSGRERIGVAADTGNNPVDEDRLEERDALFYSSVENESFLDFEPGNFAVFFPYDVHRPVCMVGDKPEEIHKVVVKISTDLLR